MSYSVPPAQFPRIEPDVAILHRHGEDRVEQSRVSQLPTLDQIDRLEVGFLEVKPVGDHELDLVLLCHPDHGKTVFLGDRQWLLTENVGPEPRAARSVYSRCR